MAWQSASRPVALVTLAGAVRVNAGSTMATSGMSGAPAMSIFTSACVFVMMANCVASEPVPAVVGMATMGQTGPEKPSPRNESMSRPLETHIAMAFMVSMGEPPPSAIMKSQPSCW